MKPQKGRCPECKRTYTVNRDGTLRRHWARDDQGEAVYPFRDCSGRLPEGANRSSVDGG